MMTRLEDINTRASPASGRSPLSKKPRLHSPSPLPIEEAEVHDNSVLALDGPEIRAPSAKKSRKAKKKQKHVEIEAYSSEDVVFQDVKQLLGQDVLERAVAEGVDWKSPFEHREEVMLIVTAMSSTGESLNPHSGFCCR